jgi:signal peptidase I
MLVPGAGHFMLGRWPISFCLAACFAILVVCFWPLRLLRFYGGILVLFASWIALVVYATFSAQLSRSAQNGARASRWWFLGTLPVSLVVRSLSGGALTRASGFRSFEVPSTAMEPTILRGDHIITDIFEFRPRGPRRPEVIVFKKDGIFFLKRVIAVGGDTVEGKTKPFS